MPPPLEWLSSKRHTITSVGEDMEEWDSLDIALLAGMQDVAVTFRKQSIIFSNG